MRKIFNDDISLVICGEAGQGVQTIEALLIGVFKSAGFNIFATKEYMSRVRGGSNSTEIRVSSQKKRGFLNRIDLLVALDRDALDHLSQRITGSTVLILDRERIPAAKEAVDGSFSRIAAEAGGPIFSNTAAAGLILGLFGIEKGLAASYIGKMFSPKGAEVVQKNIWAAEKGYEIGHGLAAGGIISVKIRPDPAVKNEIVMSGAQAVALGAAAGGCDFVSAYPMTPSTGILTYLSKYSDELGIITEQAEDEISAVNMAIGAWYAGARGFVVTAGGGFALMTEALSLSGMIESPLVVSLGQRPAPATGLPTRTEQADLEQALYAGHGEFPRAVFAPGTVEDAFSVTQKAFSLADRYQVPVIVLSDQYLADCYYNLPAPDTYAAPVKKHFVKTEKDYRRYELKLNADGVSPRGIPGYGQGLVCADSDEHDEEGHITEDPAVRAAMNEKRLAKLELLKKEALPPELYGPEDYKTLVVGWGSTFGTVLESIEALGRPDTAFLHFKQVYPIHPSTAGYLQKASNIVIVENNATSQFGRLIKLWTGFEPASRILKYDGTPFSVEELSERLRKAAGQRT